MGLTTWKFTVKDYHKMAELGILHPDERLELIDGEILKMSPIGRRHAAYVTKIANHFMRLLGSEMTIVNVQNPIILNDLSEPEPDVSLLKPRQDQYFSGLPQAADVYLVIEVAESSLESDRSEKLPRYAAAAIPEVWLINALTHQLECYRHPDNGRYREYQTLERGDSLRLVSFPDVLINLDSILFEG
ncbi:MAG: Uma2 family endonuclease [Phormidium sp. BM_Day4_Bin.17]|nr:Uma2 family endonuclease [Phormidium sp. BM_Day4_Bin.17]UCJ12444.1 MAG: Uma2 family endonuclease [Phormidium sp. PBR-2020]